MGVVSTPDISVEMIHRPIPVVYDNRRKDHNHVSWVPVVLNIPERRSYEPSKPWVYKKRRGRKIAGDIICFVDNWRGVGQLEQVCCETLH